MVYVIPLCVDTYLLADVNAMWKMLNHNWIESCFCIILHNNISQKQRNLTGNNISLIGYLHLPLNTRFNPIVVLTSSTWH